METIKFRIAILVLISAAFTSCSEVLIEDNIYGTWELMEYIRNDVNESSEVHISVYEESYSPDGVFSRKYLDVDQNLVEEEGRFSINEDDMSIHISDVSSITDFSEANSTLSTSMVDVLSIAETEYIYSFTNGGDSHEFRFIKKDP